MTEIYIAYKPIRFADLDPSEDQTRNRVSKSMLVQKMEAEANATFLKKGVIDPFEEALVRSDREEFNTGEFVIEIGESSSSPKTKWAKIHERLSEYLDVRADDSRAATFEGVQYFEGVGYCLRVTDLQSHIEKLTDEETSKPGKSKTLKWPSKKRGEEYPTEISIPEINFNRVTREGGLAALEAKRFVAGVSPNVVKPYQEEMERWFEANTGYAPPKKIPDAELGHDERIIEFARGSYGQVQLVREENPKYQEALKRVNTALQDMRDNLTVQQFRSTNDAKGVPYVNIKSVREFLKPESMKKNDLVKVEHRYVITP